MLGIRLFLPFAAGYFLSYLFRTANAIIGPELARTLTLDDNALGLLTSTYFLAFGLFQLPLGLLLDRFGPRRVESGLLLFAAAGALVFALADGLTQLAIGRALLGLGVSACLMASFKAFAQWFPAERQASLTGWIMASGGLGALTATTPLELALGFTGWREIFLALAAATLLVAAALFFAVPDRHGHHRGEDFGRQLAGLLRIYASHHFWRYAPMGFCFTGGFMAVQGLWATRWMIAVEGMTRAESASRLGAMGLAMLAGFLFMGFFATGLVRRGVPLIVLYGGGMAAGLLSFAAIVFAPGALAPPAWVLLGACFSLSNVAYALVAQGFELSASGRANTALNLLVFAGAFGLQWGLGALVTLLGSLGLSEATAFRTAFSALFATMLAAFAWFALGARKR